MSNPGSRPEKGPEKKIMNEELKGECPKCGLTEIIWRERVLLVGSLENYHLVHTEVDDYYECKTCKNTWKEFSYL